MKKCVTLLILILCFTLYSHAFAVDLKIGSINMRKVFYEYKKTKDFNQKLEGEDAKVREDIDKRTQDIRKLRDEIDLLSKDAKEKRETELRQKIKELDEYRRSKIDEFIQKKDEMFKEIRMDIEGVAAEYAKNNGYDLIFDEAIFVYQSNKYDITDHIIKELNK